MIIKVVAIIVGLVANSPQTPIPQGSLPLQFTAVRDGDLGTLTIKSIREIANSSTSKSKTEIEIEVQNTQPFHIGELDWCLSIDRHQLCWPAKRSTDHRVLTWVLRQDDWEKLKEGAPMSMTWGCYDAIAKGEKPFARLAKQSLVKWSPGR
jgi:hypothetical protein